MSVTMPYSSTMPVTQLPAPVGVNITAPDLAGTYGKVANGMANMAVAQTQMQTLKAQKVAADLVNANGGQLPQSVNDWNNFAGKMVGAGVSPEMAINMASHLMNLNVLNANLDAYNRLGGASNGPAQGPTANGSANPNPTGQPGAQPGYLGHVIGAESGGDPNAQNPASSARGMGQFTSVTRNYILNKYGVDAWSQDPAQQVQALKYLTNENQSTLTGSLGRPPSDTELYAAHFLGAAGANKFLAGAASAPNDPAANYVDPQAVKANPTIFFDNTTGKPRTNAELMGMLNSKIGGGAGGTQYAQNGPVTGSDASGGPTPAGTLPTVSQAATMPASAGTGPVATPQQYQAGIAAAQIAALKGDTKGIIEGLTVAHPEWDINKKVAEAQALISPNAQAAGANAQATANVDLAKQSAEVPIAGAKAGAVTTADIQAKNANQGYTALLPDGTRQFVANGTQAPQGAIDLETALKSNTPGFQKYEEDLATHTAASYTLLDAMQRLKSMNLGSTGTLADFKEGLGNWASSVGLPMPKTIQDATDIATAKKIMAGMLLPIMEQYKSGLRSPSIVDKLQSTLPSEGLSAQLLDGILPTLQAEHENTIKLNQFMSNATPLDYKQKQIDFYNQRGPVGAIQGVTPAQSTPTPAQYEGRRVTLKDGRTGTVKNGLFYEGQ